MTFCSRVTVEKKWKINCKTVEYKKKTMMSFEDYSFESGLKLFTWTPGGSLEVMYRHSTVYFIGIVMKNYNYGWFTKKIIQIKNRSHKLPPCPFISLLFLLPLQFPPPPSSPAHCYQSITLLCLSPWLFHEWND